MQIIHTLVTGQAFYGIPVQELGAKGPLLQKILSVVGVTADAKEIINYFHKTFAKPENAWEKPIMNARSTPRLNLYILGFPVRLPFEIKFVGEVLKAMDGHTYEVKEGFIIDKVIDYDKLETRLLKKAPVGKFVHISATA